MYVQYNNNLIIIFNRNDDTIRFSFFFGEFYIIYMILMIYMIDILEISSKISKILKCSSYVLIHEMPALSAQTPTTTTSRNPPPLQWVG